MSPSSLRKVPLGVLFFMMACCGANLFATGAMIFNVKDYGATGVKADNARPAIQKAIDACAAAGGGEVYLPPGEYTSGTLKLRSHVRFYVEAGATLYGSTDMKDFSDAPTPFQAALFYGEGVQNITIEGRGTVDGQAKFIWLPDDMDDVFIRAAKDLMKSMGKSLLRTFPEGYPKRNIYPHLIYLGNCKDVRITGLSFLHSQSWTFLLHFCERVVVDGVYIHTSLEEAIWCDGIDMDGCKDIRIANSSIETGDDCIIFVSISTWGPARPCENVTVTNCRLSSSANAIKCSEGNEKGVRNVVIDNCVITDSSQGIVICVTDGGFVSDLQISNVTINLRRFDWYHLQGGAISFIMKRRSEWAGTPVQKGEPIPGVIRNIAIRNVIAHCTGPSNIDGHPESPIDGLTLENIKLILSTDPAAPYDMTVHGMRITNATNLKLKGIEVQWEKPALDKWQSALDLENVQGVELDDFTGRQAWPDRDFPAVAFDNVSDAMIRDSKAAEGTGIFLGVRGKKSGEICLFGNDLRKAEVPYQIAPESTGAKVTALQNFLPPK
jgi:hypothetical protein